MTPKPMKNGGKNIEKLPQHLFHDIFVHSLAKLKK